MKRREFITLLGGAAAAATFQPLGGRAQQAATPVVGFLHSGSSEGSQRDIAGFRQGLKESGFIDGENLRIEFRWARDRLDQLPTLAAGLVRDRVNAIYTLGGVAPALAAKNATSTIPIVFTHGSDPVRAGLVASFNRPGGNVTGLSLFTGEITAKRLELLREMVPKAAVIAVLVNPNTATGETRITGVEQAARALGLKLQVLNVTSASDLDAAFKVLDQKRADALFLIADPLFTQHRDKIQVLATNYSIPTMHSSREGVAAGGLMSYGTDVPDVVRQAGIYIGRILKGAKPADLPVMLPTKFTLAINLKTAKALGLTVPLTLQVAADEVIE